ncbi:hypothetical protein M0811_04581 [Anaeramoeba ignava]|uniref:MHD2 domain-containing protein n=1 Tax=Anaeramoeba ignava TaxID=1746090 RepID=A0A9Q0LTR6_ANAIG|nr:hypothetical protein M0811_04581 [Anaeramoeba ignava]
MNFNFIHSIFDLWKVVVSIKEIFYQVLSQEIIELIAKPFFEDLYQIFRKYSRLVRITFSKSKKSNQQIISNESQKNQQIKQKSNQFIPNESQKNQQIKQKSNQQIISNESQKNQQIKQKSNQQIISNESQKNHQFITNESQRIKTIELIVDNKFPRYLISQNCVRLNNLSLVIDLFNKLCNEFKQKTEEMMKQEEYFDYGNILNENNNNNNNNEKNIKAFPFQTTQNKLKNFVKKKCVFPTAKFISSQIIFYQLREAFSFKLYLPDINYRINNVLIYLVSILSEIQNDLTNEEHKQNLFDFIYDDFLKCFEYVLLEGGRFYSPDDTPIIVEDLDFIIQFFAGKKNSDIKFSISEDQVNNKIQKIRKILLNLFPLSTENLISLFSTLGTIIQEKEPFIKINFQRILLERKDFQK